MYLGGFCLLILTLIFHQIIKGDYYSQRAKNNYLRVVPSYSIRGTIFDRNGIQLAYDIASFNISVIPYQIKSKKDQLFTELSFFLSTDKALIYKGYKANLKSYFSPVNIVNDVNKLTALKAKEEFKNLILINPQPKRFYPQNYSLAHIIGYVKKAASKHELLKKYGYSPLERIGFIGLEQYYDSYLKGEDGGDLIEIDAKGKVVGFLGTRLPKKGKDIHLTVDSRIQQVARGSLSQKGVIILMNSYSGEIIALYSSPSFNPNNFVEGKNINKFFNNKDSPLLNRVLQSKYPMGSTFKPILAAAALAEQKINPGKTFNCNGSLSIGIAKFKCMGAHLEQNIYQAMAHSCNVYFYNLGLLTGAGPMSKWAKKFGLDSHSNIDLPYEKKGFIPSPQWKQAKLKKNWFAGDTVNLSIGQGYVNVTPLEAMLAINVFANDGYLVAPYILKKVDKKLTGASLTNTYIGVSDSNLKIIQRGLRQVVTDKAGTARMLQKLNLKISGKTGTAQNRGRPHGWFIGFFPYNGAKYTICVFLENGGSSHQALRVTYNFLKKITENNLL